MFKQCKRALSPNGSLFCFADDLIGAYVHVEADKHFNVLNSIVWVKPNNRTMLGWSVYRKFTPITERIIFCEQKDAYGMPATGLEKIHSNPDCFATIKAYMRAERDKLMESEGMNTLAEFDRFINELTKTNSVVSRHYFADSQYMFPTKELYEIMQTTGFWRREYEDLRRPFFQKENYTDVWITCITSTYEDCTHPTQKPLKMIRTMIETCTKGEGDIVLDPFMGSGTTAAACRQLGRHYIGFETDPEYHRNAVKRAEDTFPLYRKTLLDY